MSGLIERLSRFLASMDAKAWTSLAVSAALLLVVVLAMAFGRQWLQLEDGDGLARVLEQAADSPLALPVVMLVFCLLALTGFPQVLLITGAVVAFGPRLGAFYAWLATMTSASMTFGIGRFLGGGWVERVGGARATSLVDFLRRRGVFASALIRVVPSAPFIVVNAAAGTAKIPLWKFWAGTGLGIAPKIALVAVLGTLAPDRAAVADGLDGLGAFFASLGPRHFAMLAGVAAVWLGFIYLARRLYGRYVMKEDGAGEKRD